MNVRQHKSQTCVLAYSGGLDTSVAVAWLRETHGFEVVTVTGDLGTVKDLEGIQKKALASGAKRAIVQDVRDIFVRYFVWPALQAGALYEERVIDAASGRVLNPNLEFYKLTAAADFGEIVPVLDIRPEHDKRGVVGLGEPPVIPGIAAIANAVANALGVRVPRLPMTPDRVLAALERRNA